MKKYETFKKRAMVAINDLINEDRHDVAEEILKFWYSCAVDFNEYKTKDFNFLQKPIIDSLNSKLDATK